MADLGITVNEGRYLKFLYRRQLEETGQNGTIALAEAFRVQPATVTEMLQKLSKKGLLRYTRYHGADLTQKGIIEAEQLLRKHRVLEILFVKHLNYSSQKACEEANKLDHHVSDKLINTICQVYGHPQICPCGNPIFTDNACCSLSSSL